MNLAIAPDPTQTETPSTQTPAPRLALIKGANPADVETLDFTAALIINRGTLAAALVEARRVSDVLHNVENLDDLNWYEMSDLCRRMHGVVCTLGEMLDVRAAKGGAR